MMNNSNSHKALHNSGAEHNTKKIRAQSSHQKLDENEGKEGKEEKKSEESGQYISNNESQTVDDIVNKLQTLSKRHPERVTVYLAQKGELYSRAFSKYMGSYTFKDTKLEDALSGESQQIERVLEHFSAHYHDENPNLFPSKETVLMLSYAILLLNTDLHSPGNIEKISRYEFLDNFYTSFGRTLFTEQELLTLYDSIKKHPLPLPPTYKAPSKPPFLARKQALSLNKALTPKTITLSPSLTSFTEIDNETLIEKDTDAEPVLKKGHLNVKHVLSELGKPASKRTWKKLNVALRGSQLILSSINKPQKPEQTLIIRHTVAKVIEFYPNRQFLFSLELWNGQCFYFECGSSKDREDWISTLNRMAALHSSRPMSCPVSSSLSTAFVIPCPSLRKSAMGDPEQFQFITSKIASLKDEIEHLVIERSRLTKAFGNSSETEMNGKPPLSEPSKKAMKNWSQKLNYLNWELQKYEIYHATLRGQHHYLTIPYKQQQQQQPQ